MYISLKNFEQKDNHEDNEEKLGALLQRCYFLFDLL